MRKAAHPDVKSALLTWLQDTHAHGIPVNGLLLSSRTEQLPVALGQGDVSFSEGWPGQFKAQYDAVFSAALSPIGKQISCPHFLQDMRTRTYLLQTSVDWCKKTRPARHTLSPVKSVTVGCARKSACLSLFCCNKDGSEKVRLPHIKKAKRPYFPCKASGSYGRLVKKTKHLFNTWLLKFYRKMAK